MNKLFIVVAIFFVIGSCVSVVAHTMEQSKGGRGNILYVGGSGPGNYSTINAAVRDASDGDLIFVYDDNSPYGEADITKELTIMGENRTTTEVSQFNVYDDNIRITGFTIDSWFYSNMKSNITIENNIIKNSMSIYAGSFNRFINNTMYVYYNDLYEDADNLDFRGQQYGTVAGNTFILEENANTAISVIYDYGSNVFANNTVISHGGLTGICIVYSLRNTFEGNTCIQCGFNLEDIDAYTNNFHGNSVNGKSLLMLKGESNKTIDATDDVGQLFLDYCHYVNVHDLNISNVPQGIAVLATTNCNISNNAVSSCLVGMSLLSSDANVVSYSLITNCSTGIQIDTCQHNTVERNSIERNALGITISGDNLQYFALKPNTIKENNFMKNARNARFAYTRTVWWHNYWNMPRLLPKVILGTSYSKWLSWFPYSNLYLNFPWINVDWHPAKEPFDFL